MTRAPILYLAAGLAIAVAGFAPARPATGATPAAAPAATPTGGEPATASSPTAAQPALASPVEAPTDPAAAPRITVKEAAALRDAGKAVIVDVRDAASYELGHAAGALNIPLAELPNRLGDLPHDKRVLTYCA